jgi:hypothetical protein
LIGAKIMNTSNNTPGGRSPERADDHQDVEPGIDADEMTTPHHDGDPGIDKLPKQDDKSDPLPGKNKRDSNEAMPARRRV